MGKRYVSPNAVCPFYNSEAAQKVYCEGVTAGCNIHLAFGDKTALKEYIKRYCYKDYDKCIVAKMLESKYEEE